MPGKRGIAAPLASFLIRPAALATLLLIRLNGAPVSKISRNGPSPLILTMTVRCCVLIRSNGTLTGLAFGSSARAAAAANSARRVAVNTRFMLEALPGGHGDLLLVLAAQDGEADSLAGGHPGGPAQHV